MTKRLAFFVEGYSEVLFVEKLLHEIAGKNNITIERAGIKGGNKFPRQFTIYNATNQVSGIAYYVLIINCQGDKQVKTRMREEHSNFSKGGYEKIIGLRDVFPDFDYADLPKLHVSINRDFDPALIPVEIVLSVMEIEAIFLGESTHFQRIDPALSISSIKSSLGFDPAVDDMELRATAAADLASCYSLVGKTYDKYHVQDTIDALDFADLYLDQPKRFSSLSRLVSNINAFLD